MEDGILDAIRESLKKVIDGQQKVELAVNSLTEQMRPCVKRINDLERIINGNGDPGLKVSVALLESRQKEFKAVSDKLLQRMWKLIATVVTALIAIIGSALTFLIKGE